MAVTRRRAMMLTTLILIAAPVCLEADPTGLPAAQTVTTEVDVTAGYSSERVRTAATQARAFGETHGLRFYAEASWARFLGSKSDAFASAFPYEQVHVMEVYAEKMLRQGRYLAAVRVGRYRTPFGISGRSDHAYSGFLRAPLIRYDGYFALSNLFLEGGVDVIAGVPHLLVEASLGVPQDAQETPRRPGLDAVGRVQAYYGPWIVGVSHIRTRPYQPATFAHGDTTFTGIDVRWMHDGILLRGEWIDGVPFAGTRTYGGYVDAIVHRPFMGPVTAVARLELVDYLAGVHSTYPRRATAGARIRLSDAIAAQVNVLRQRGIGNTVDGALDVALTYSIRR